MAKTLALIKANLKGFARNWKSIIILIVMPLLLIMFIFLSFNPNGLRKIPMGYSLAEQQTLDEHQFTEATGSFAKLTRYGNNTQCLSALQTYKEYACIHIKGSGPYVLDVYYDNTREPVIWEVIQRIEQVVRSVQKQESKNIATDFLTRFSTALGKLDAYETQLNSVNSNIDGYVRAIETSSSSLRGAKSELQSTIANMDNDIEDAKSSVANARSTKYTYLSTARQQLQITDSNLQYLMTAPEYQAFMYSANTNALLIASNANNNLQLAKATVENMNNKIDTNLQDVDMRLVNYEQTSSRGKTYLVTIDSGIAQLQNTRNDLKTYQTRIQQTRDELTSVKNEFSSIKNLDAETLVNPIIIHNTPTYIPQIDQKTAEKLTKGLTEQEAAVKGVSLISLQTIFPTVLILITLFLSLLVGSFVALSEINATAHTRLRLIRNIFFPEFLASFISSLIIVATPIFIVMLIGDSIFQLGIFEHTLQLGAVMLLLITTFILLGFSLAYIIRKESLTLMISTFLLVLLIFLSGFLLPIERMSQNFGMIATYSPGAVAADAFKLIVFYNSGLYGARSQVTTLLLEATAFFILALLLKKYREK